MNADEFLDSLQRNGRYSFTLNEAIQVLGKSRAAVLNMLSRLKKNKRLVSPANEFYLLVTPEYQVYGCLPADMFIDKLMKHFSLPYYVGFISAAHWHGAAHQKPQRFQVVTTQPRRTIHCGRIFIRFIVNKNMEKMPVKLFNTYTGTMKVATPEVLAADLVSFPRHAAGMDNVATILLELAEQIDPNKLTELTKIHSEVVWVQRLGYLFEFLGFSILANVLEKALKDKKTHWKKLICSASSSVLDRNKKWKIIVNTQIEPDDI